MAELICSNNQPLWTTASRFGRPAPGLAHGLTRPFRLTEVLVWKGVTEIGLPPRTAVTVRALTGHVAAEDVVLDSRAATTELVTCPSVTEGVAACAAEQMRCASAGGTRSRRAPRTSAARCGNSALSRPVLVAEGRQSWRVVAVAHLTAYEVATGAGENRTRGRNAVMTPVFHTRDEHASPCRNTEEK